MTEHAPRGALVAVLGRDQRIVAEVDPEVRFDLSHLNADTQTVAGLELPRYDLPLFRGLRVNNPQARPTKLLRAILGDASAPIESKTFSLARWELGKSLPEDALVHRTKEVLRDHFDFERFPRRQQSEAYVGLDRATYVNWPEDAIFSTYYPGIGIHYSESGYMLALHDYGRRGIDLNHAMGQAGEADSVNDLGEHLMPMLIDASELDGVFFLRRNLAVFATMEDGVRYGLIFRNSPCLFKGGDQRIYRCTAKAKEEYAFYETPLRTDKRVFPSAVLAWCDDGKDCALPDGFFERHGVALSAPGDEFFDVDISAVRVGKKAARVFYNTGEPAE